VSIVFGIFFIISLAMLHQTDDIEVAAFSSIMLTMTFYPMSAGRNFEEILRLVDALKMADQHKIATPVNWKHGDAVLIPPSVSDEEATRLFPQGWTATKPGGGPESQQRPYLRYVKV